jgi:hypothetical protein
MASVISASYEGRQHLLPCEAGESVAALRATLAEAVGVPPRELSLRAGAPSGAVLADGKALLEYGAGVDAVFATRVTTLGAVAAGAAALLSSNSARLFFFVGMPLVAWFGLRRRGLPLAAVFSGLRLPFAE